MSSNPTLFALLIGWPTVVFSALTGRLVLLGSGLSVSEYAIWFFLAAAPVAAYLILLRDRSPKSGSQGLIRHRAGR